MSVRSLKEGGRLGKDVRTVKGYSQHLTYSHTSHCPRNQLRYQLRLHQTQTQSLNPNSTLIHLLTRRMKQKLSIDSHWNQSLRNRVILTLTILTSLYTRFLIKTT